MKGKINQLNEYNRPIGKWDGMLNGWYIKGLFYLNAVGLSGFSGFRRKNDHDVIRNGCYIRNSSRWGYYERSDTTDDILLVTSKLIFH